MPDFVSSARTLTALRRDAPKPDRTTPALAPSPANPNGYKHGPKSTYVPVSLKARTLTELRQWCTQNALSPNISDAAVKDAKWSAVTAWIMWGPVGLSNPLRVASLSVILSMGDDRARLGYPNAYGANFTSPLIDYSPDVQAEAIRVAAETLVDWKRAGRPRLTSAIERVQSYMAGHIKRSTATNIQEQAA